MSFQRCVEPEWSSKNVHLFFISPVLFSPFFCFSVPVLLYKSQQRRVVVSCLTLPFKLSDTHWKKKSASRNQTLLKEKMLLPIRSGRLTTKIPDKGIKAYVSEHEHVWPYFLIHDLRSVWAFSCRKLHSTCWCHCKAACKLSMFCCLQTQWAELLASTNWLKTTQVSDLKCYANTIDIYLYSEDSNINK